ncbi:tegument protein UL21 [Ateline alphaherpesvirus 1]|uniref:Tegument protein UL21 n=1 Tax=Herpesvirus ateles type 1 (strain Lennette) TaxID=35243 RepID=A0A1S6JLP4_HSVA1|nr:tegument protein UL21 [Ateline alphaherpesvirus 1]AQS79195.1 tegument protein UL21 [Ateline alphaherpesvirus 1]
MELSYHTTLHHREVVFYLTRDANRAYFVCGGVVYSVGRAAGDHPPGEIAKFGLALRGAGPNDRVVANYVRSELRRRADAEAAPPPPGEDEVFLDCVGLLGPRVAAEADLRNSPSVEVEDECLAEYLTSLRTSPGVTVTGVRVSPSTKTIQVLETPDIVNSASGFAYTPAPHAFVLVQAHLSRLPDSLAPLAAGAFDGIPAPRRPLAGAAPPRTDVLVTGSRAARPLAVAPPREPGGRRRAAVSEFVQVKLIGAADAGASGGGAAAAPGRRKPPAPAPTLADLWAVFRHGDAALGAPGGVPGLGPEEEATRDLLRRRAWALFGSAEAPRAFLGAASGLSPAQKLAVAYYLLQRERRPTPLAAMVRAARLFAAERGAAETPPDEPALAEAVNGVFRDLLLLGGAAELLLMFDALPPREARGSAVGEADAEALLRIASAARGPEAPRASAEHVRFLGMLASLLYAGRDRLAASVAVARATGLSSLVLTAGDVNRACAFGRGPGGAAARARAAACLTALMARHLEYGQKAQDV